MIDIIYLVYNDILHKQSWPVGAPYHSGYNDTM